MCRLERGLYSLEASLFKKRVLPASQAFMKACSCMPDEVSTSFSPSCSDVGTVFLNCAVVPRHKNVPGKGNRISHFVLVQLQKGMVTAADNIWIGQTEDGQTYQHHTENLMSSSIEDGSAEKDMLPCI